MHDHKDLAGRFEANRRHLRSVALRMLGTASEAEDAVQEAWLRLSRSETAGVDNLRGWLTTVVARICLDMLRARKARGEEQLDPDDLERAATSEPGGGLEHEAELADSVGLALLVVLEKLAPAERIAFVLHDMFNMPFEEIAPIVGRSATTARQLASRARRRVQGATAESDTDRARRREIVDAFLAASRGGDMGALLAVLDPEVVFRADATAARMGGQAEIRGAPAVAATFKGRAQAARTALVDGAVGVAVMLGGQLRIVLDVAIKDGRIVAIEAIADPERVRGMDVTILD